MYSKKETQIILSSWPNYNQDLVDNHRNGSIERGKILGISKAILGIPRSYFSHIKRVRLLES